MGDDGSEYSQSVQNDEERNGLLFLIHTQDYLISENRQSDKNSLPPSTRPVNSSKRSLRWFGSLFVLLLLVVILFITDRIELFPRHSTSSSSSSSSSSIGGKSVIHNQSPSTPQDFESKSTRDEIRTQRLQLMTKFDFSKPSAINYTALVKELGLAKVFKPKFQSSSSSPISSLPSWCTYDPEHPWNQTEASYMQAPYTSGILYNKMPKAASSTLSGIVLRIAHNVAKRFLGAGHHHPPCTSFQQHIETEGNVRRLFEDRDWNKSFLFSSVRDPADQALSHIFFRHVSRRYLNASDANMMMWLTDTDHQNGVISRGMGGFQIEYLAFERLTRYYAWNRMAPTKVVQPIHVHNVIQGIMDKYDFFISVERFDESLVVLQLLLGLQTSDILYISSKKAGGSYSYNKGKGCFFLQKPFASAAVAAYLASDKWYAQQYGDYVLVETVKQSLDMTIEYLGERRFDKALQEFRAMKRDGEGACADKANFPCSENGEEQLVVAENSCYMGDWGCGYACLDDMSSGDNRT